MAIPRWVWGVLLSFSGCALSNLGVNMQKLAHTRAAAAGDPESYTRAPMWIVGLSLVIIGSLGDLLAFKFADMSLLAPLGAMTLVLNMCIAPCFLKEELTQKDIFFTLVIVGGTVVCIIFGSKKESDYLIDELMNLYSAPAFVVFAVVLSVIILIIFILLRQILVREKKKVLTIWDIRFRAFIYPCLAGTFGALTVLFAKSSMEIVTVTFAGDNQFTHFFSYVEIFMLGSCLFLQMKFLNMGLEKADALFVVPVYQVFWVVMNVVAGMIYFQDFKTLTWAEMFFFITGLLVTLLGVLFLTQRTTQKAVVPDGNLLPRNSLTTLTANERLIISNRRKATLLGLRATFDKVEEKPNLGKLENLSYPYHAVEQNFKEIEFSGTTELSFGMLTGL